MIPYRWDFSYLKSLIALSGPRMPFSWIGRFGFFRGDNDLDFATFTSSFDAFVAVLIELLEVISQPFLLRVILIGGKLLRQPVQGLLVKLVHMRLEIAQLSEDLAWMSIFGRSTTVQLAGVFLLRGAGIRAGSLTVGSLSHMTPLVCSQITQLGKGMAAGGKGACVRFLTRVRAQMDLEMSWLRKGFATIGVGAHVPLHFGSRIGRILTWARL